MQRPGYETFAACDTASDDVCLIGFTSGTTGEPKGTMHFHRDMLAICDSYGRHVLRAEAGDRFIGSPPLAFTFGLGGLVLFPLRVGASTVLLEKAAPDDLLPAIGKHRATICFTAPTAYRAMLGKLSEHDISSLRKCVSAGEALPKATFEAWHAATGSRSSTASARPRCCTSSSARREDEIRPGATGKPVPGYEARVVDDDGRELPPGTIGRLAVRGPTGCRYLADERQTQYVQRRLEHHRRHLPDGCGRLLLVPGALRRHDRLGRLQHRRPGGRSRRCSPIRRSPNAAWSARRTRSAARSSRPTSCCAPATRATRR